MKTEIYVSVRFGAVGTVQGEVTEDWMYSSPMIKTRRDAAGGVFLLNRTNVPDRFKADFAQLLQAGEGFVAFEGRRIVGVLC